MRYLIQLFISLFFVFCSSPFVFAYDDTEQLEKIDGIQAALWVQNGLISILIIAVVALIARGRG
jgi:hypothetical protein